VDRGLVAAVFRIHKAVVVAHLELAAGYQREAGQFVLRHKSRDAERQGGGYATH